MATLIYVEIVVFYRVLGSYFFGTTKSYPRMKSYAEPCQYMLQLRLLAN